MCRARHIHFTAHDVRVPIATQPFTALGGPDEFLSTKYTKCHCVDRTTALLEANASLVSASHFQSCLQHGCCVQWCFPAARCEWFWNNPDMGPMTSCPNYREDNEYRPIAMVMDTTGADGKAAVGGCGDWQRTGEETPLFPAAEMFYSDENGEGHAAIPGSWGLSGDRREVERCGRDLREAKEDLQERISRLETYIEGLEQTLSTDTDLKVALANPLTFQLRMEVADGMIRRLDHAELGAASFFGWMMKYTGFVLTVIDRMPAEGESIAAADGSYTISRQQLDIGDLEKASAMRDACDGPLNQAGNLRMRFRRLNLEAHPSLRWEEREEQVLRLRLGSLPLSVPHTHLWVW